MATVKQTKLNTGLQGTRTDFPCQTVPHLSYAPLLSYSFSTHCLPSNGAQSIDPDDDAGLPQFRGQHKSRRLRMANGTVKWFNTTKGFGFIAPDTGGKDVFVHISAVERSGLTGLADDQKVTYDVEAGRDGRESATNLQLA